MGSKQKYTEVVADELKIGVTDDFQESLTTIIPDHNRRTVVYDNIARSLLDQATHSKGFYVNLYMKGESFVHDGFYSCNIINISDNHVVVEGLEGISIDSFLDKILDNQKFIEIEL